MTQQYRTVESRREGRLAAERLRNRLGLAAQPWVDVFGIIETQFDLELLFRPLKRLYGFYWSSEGHSGVVINSSHPSSLRRFTAAHELGHHVLGHGHSVDECQNIEGTTGTKEAAGFESKVLPALGSDAAVKDRSREAAAQAFAGSFLMPLGAVNRYLGYLDQHAGSPVDRRISADCIYKLAVEFGVSLRAACTQLASLNKIDWSYCADVLKATSAFEIATQLGCGFAPRHKRADVVVGNDIEGVQVIEHDAELIVELIETPTTGHVWMLDEVPKQLNVISDRVVSDDHDGERLGGNQTRHIRFSVVEPGYGLLKFGLRPAWQPDAKAARSRTVEVLTREPVFDQGCALSRRKLRERITLARTGSPE